MKKNLFAVLLMIGALVMATSCKDDVEDPTLTLSEYSIDFPKSASEKAVTITTNQEEWTATANQSWVELVQSGNTLTIKVEANTMSKSRKAEVVVMARAAKKIAIMQSAGDTTFDTNPNEYNFDQWGGKETIKVKTNSENWTVSTDADWVTLNQFSDEITVTVAENKAREARVAKLILSGANNNGAKEFTIHQSGVMYYILPLVDPVATKGQIKEFELARKSELVIDFNYIVGGAYTFTTKSTISPQIQYAFVQGTDRLERAVVVVKNPKVSFQDPEFLKMFTDDGYKAKDAVTYVKEVKVGEDIIIISASLITANDALGGVIFDFVPKQPKAMPTFKEFPYGYIEFGKDLETVTAWEKEHGGVYNTERSSQQEGYWYHFFDVKGIEDIIGRAYFIGDEGAEVGTGLLETGQYYTKQSLAFYQVNGMTYLTEEFMALAKKEGFEYQGFSNQWHRFFNKEKKLMFLLRWVKYSNFPSAVIDVHLYEKSLEGSSLEPRSLDLNEYYPTKVIKSSEVKILR